MKKCILILPYFGKFHNYFDLFLKSCSKNLEYDWLIITNDHIIYNYPVNVQVKYMEFIEFKNIIQSKFEFKIALDRPYKLCDFKPTYGYVLEEWIQDYEYWGHCDCDLLFGNLQNLLSPLLEKKYDKLFAAGHLTIYRNTSENNKRFMLPFKGEYIYKEALGNSQIYAFDEQFHEKNIDVIFSEHGFNLFTNDLSFNCSPQYYNIKREYYSDGKWIVEASESIILYWDDGEVKSIIFNKEKKCLESKSYLYVHLQGRDMKIHSLSKNSDCIRIEPEKFTLKSECPTTIKEWRRQQKIYFSIKIIKLFMIRIYFHLLKYKLREWLDYLKLVK